MIAAAVALGLALIGARITAPPGDRPSPSWHLIARHQTADGFPVATFQLEPRALKCRPQDCRGALVTITHERADVVLQSIRAGRIGIKCRLRAVFSGLCVRLSGCGPRWEGTVCE